MDSTEGAARTGDLAGSEREEFTSAGEPVCWLEQVCDECGALIEAALPATCWRCGAPVVPR